MSEDAAFVTMDDDLQLGHDVGLSQSDDERTISFIDLAKRLGFGGLAAGVTQSSGKQQWLQYTHVYDETLRMRGALSQR